MAGRGERLAATIPQAPAATLKPASMPKPAPAPNSSGTVQPRTMARLTSTGSNPKAKAATETASRVPARYPISPSTGASSTPETKTGLSNSNATWAMTAPSHGAASAYPVRACA
jgi:hypothetical protein